VFFAKFVKTVLFQLKIFEVPLFQEAGKRGSRVKIPRGRATVKRFWILDFGFWIVRIIYIPAIQNPKSKIQNRQVRKPALKHFAERMFRVKNIRGSR